MFDEYKTCNKCKWNSEQISSSINLNGDDDGIWAETSIDGEKNRRWFQNYSIN